MLSHGNATVESGFSVNKEILVENLKGSSIISQRIVYDAVRFSEGHLNVTITKDMLRYWRNARGIYEDELKKIQKSERDSETEVQVRKRELHELEEIRAKKRKLEEELKEIDGGDSRFKELHRKYYK